MAAAAALDREMSVRQRWDRWWTRNQIKVLPYVFISPFFIVFAMFLAYPVVDAVVVSLMFGILYDYNSGFLNALLSNLFGPDAKVGWIRDPKVALWSILIISISQFTGLNSLYFLAGLQNIPKEVEEAAIIDGAGKWALLWSITLPMLRPVILFVVVQAINGSYQLFAQPLLLTGGGPSDATVTM